MLIAKFVIFTFSFLMFTIEPMVAKYLLPTFGGTPMVWNVCLVFFQIILLIGYLVADLLVKHISYINLKITALIILSIPFIFYFTGIRLSTPSLDPNSSLDNPFASINYWLIIYVLPVFLPLASCPIIIQYLISKQEKNIYQLYAWSNLGSLIGLISYPIITERFLTLDQQSNLIYILFAVIIGILSIFLSKLKDNIKNDDQVLVTQKFTEFKTAVILSAIPSALLLAVTNYILTDIASLPIFWVIPLSLYLLTYIIAFSGVNYRFFNYLWRLSAFLLTFLLLCLIVGANEPHWLLISLHLVLFFSISLLLHIKLASLKPIETLLTKYYLSISLGGMLGSLVISFVPPIFFKTTIEYPLLLILFTFVYGFIIHKEERLNIKDCLNALIALSLVMICFYCFSTLELQQNISILLIYGPAFMFAYSTYGESKRFSLVLLTIFLSTQINNSSREDILFRARNFFGSVRVVADKERNCNTFYHGNTKHGMQCFEKDETKPLTYFSNTGPLPGLIAYNDQIKSRFFAIIGMGVGSIGYYVNQTDKLDYFEIDPLVKEIANNQDYFTLIANTKSQNVNSYIVDGRIGLSKSINYYDVIIVDAFSSDSIPTHLLTKEAIEVYQSRLTEKGIIIFHISNRFFDLSGILGRLADELGFSAYRSSDFQITEDKTKNGINPSDWIILVRNENSRSNPEILSKLLKVNNISSPLWTDQYANIFSILK